MEGKATKRRRKVKQRGGERREFLKKRAGRERDGNGIFVFWYRKKNNKSFREKGQGDGKIAKQWVKPLIKENKSTNGTIVALGQLKLSHG